MSVNRKPPEKDYAIGYGKPPTHTRFRKGASGNPKGRPKNRSKALTDILQEELLRPLRLREGDAVITMPAIRAVMRSQVNIAVKGNGPAQRNVITLAQVLPCGEPTSAPPHAKEGMDPVERARRVALMLHRAARKAEEKTKA
jgi:hypothetical protein